MRCHGRFLNLRLQEERKYPKLLPPNDHYTRLVIQDVHQKYLHSGANHTVHQLRLEYWVSKGRSAFKKVLRQCLVCRKQDGGPYAMPLMPDLPAERINRSCPFSYTGLDYLGALLVKDSSASGVHKVWVCLFTCMAVRAVHLELVVDMSTQQFLLALRRFVARRGQPIAILSDNAAQFKLARSTLERGYGKAISSEPVKDYIATEQIQWKAITERALWMGGSYERLVGSVKRALKKSIAKLLLYSVQLRTFLTEVEAVINSRPLADVKESPNDCEVLTPRHFLCLNPRLDSCPAQLTTSSTNPTAEYLLSSWKRSKQHLERFWKTWYTDYIAALRERSDFKHRQVKGNTVLSPAINDVVLIKEEFQPRGKWKMGRVCETSAGADGCVRTVKPQLSGGKSLIRPINLLYPLELKNDIPIYHKADAQARDGVKNVSHPGSSTLPERMEEPDSSFLRVLHPKTTDFCVQLYPGQNHETREDLRQNTNGQSERPSRQAKTRAKEALTTKTNTSRSGVSRMS